MSVSTVTQKALLTISSPAFEHHGNIPPYFTCEGSNVNPPLSIDGLPEGVKSIVLIVEDPDAPNGVFDHWVVWNIPYTENISEDSIPGKVGKNSKGENGYTGPCPPSGIHRYFFKVSALDTLLDLPEDATKEAVENAAQHHILAYGELIGLYRKKSNTDQS